jgi:hypothetical protein
MRVMRYRTILYFLPVLMERRLVIAKSCLLALRPQDLSSLCWAYTLCFGILASKFCYCCYTRRASTNRIFLARSRSDVANLLLVFASLV